MDLKCSVLSRDRQKLLCTLRLCLYDNLEMAKLQRQNRPVINRGREGWRGMIAKRNEGSLREVKMSYVSTVVTVSCLCAFFRIHRMADLERLTGIAWKLYLNKCPS